MVVASAAAPRVVSILVAAVAAEWARKAALYPLDTLTTRLQYSRRPVLLSAPSDITVLPGRRLSPPHAQPSRGKRTAIARPTAPRCLARPRLLAASARGGSPPPASRHSGGPDLAFRVAAPPQAKRVSQLEQAREVIRDGGGPLSLYQGLSTHPLRLLLSTTRP